MNPISKVLNGVANKLPSIPNGYYQTVGAFADKLHSVCGQLDTISAAGHYSFDIIYQISVLAKRPIQAAADMRNEILFARLTLSATRVVTTLEKLVTGKMFFEQNPDGTFECSMKGGQASAKKERTVRDVLDIIGDIGMIPARVLSPVGWVLRILIRRETWAYLKTAAFGVGIVISVSFTIGTLTYTAKSIKVMIIEGRKGNDGEIKKAVLNLIESLLSLAGSPWDNGLIMFNINPFVDTLINLGGSCINVGAKFYSIIKDVATYDIEADAGIKRRTVPENKSQPTI